MGREQWLHMWASACTTRDDPYCVASRSSWHGHPLKRGKGARPLPFHVCLMCACSNGEEWDGRVVRHNDSATTERAWPVVTRVVSGSFALCAHADAHNCSPHPLQGRERGLKERVKGLPGAEGEEPSATVRVGQRSSDETLTGECLLPETLHTPLSAGAKPYSIGHTCNLNRIACCTQGTSEHPPPKLTSKLLWLATLYTCARRSRRRTPFSCSTVR